MKRTTLTSIALLPILFASSQTIKNYEQGNPNDHDYDYLKDYAPLKNYIDYSSYPNFKLGIETTVNDYLSNPTVNGLTNDNFTETVAGNAMKMASCVNNSGTMNFTNVTRYVNAAEEAGINVYGHTQSEGLGCSQRSNLRRRRSSTGSRNGRLMARPISMVSAHRCKYHIMKTAEQ